MLKKLFKKKEKIIQPIPITTIHPYQANFDRWFADKGDSTHRLNYAFDKDSIVFDLGGYEGNWAMQIFCKYNCNVYVFEPVEKFYQQIVDKFSNNPKVQAFCYGLGEEDYEHVIYLNQDSTSTLVESGEKEVIKIKDFKSFIEENNIDCIDLLKINIEGGEYRLLEYLTKTGLVKKIKNIQVQFHYEIVENSLERMKKIQEELSKTHELTYQYEFVWENWKLKEQ